MNEHLADAKEYEALKLKLMDAHNNDRPSYTANKQEYIDRIFLKAAEWRKETC